MLESDHNNLQLVTGNTGERIRFLSINQYICMYIDTV